MRELRNYRTNVNTPVMADSTAAQGDFPESVKTKEVRDTYMSVEQDLDGSVESGLNVQHDLYSLNPRPSDADHDSMNEVYAYDI